MNLSLAQYLGFGVAALILIWAVIVINRKYFSHDGSPRTPTTWVNLDIQRTGEAEEAFPVAGEEDQEERDESDVHTRAKQNGHYSESKKPLS